MRGAAIATRPINRLIGEIEDLLARWSAPGAPRERRIVVVGAGSGGVELAFTLEARLRALGITPQVCLVQTGLFVLPGYSPSFRQKVEEAAARRGIALVLGKKAVAVERNELLLENGPPLALRRAVLGDRGGRPGDLPASGLPVDERGFLLVRPTLQSPAYEEIFAAGDCASLTEAPTTAKAGVYAVRMGPVLESNLRAKLAGKALDGYLPQRDFLTLLNLGDGTAVGGKWGFAFEGRWVMRWKDWIDRRFMQKFQVLQPNGELGNDVRQDERHGGEPGADVLRRLRRQGRPERARAGPRPVAAGAARRRGGDGARAAGRCRGLPYLGWRPGADQRRRVQGLHRRSAGWPARWRRSTPCPDLYAARAADTTP